MFDHDVEYLITALSSETRIQYDQRLLDEISANVVYHVPRVKSPDTLYRLVGALFRSQFIVQLPPLRLLHVVKDVFLWKLEVSEPTLPISKFYSVWNAVLKSYRATWNLSQLIVLDGILVTYPRFKQLNNEYFIDESSNKTALYYKNWELQLFLPMWAQFWNGATIKTNLSIQNFLLIALALLFNQSNKSDLLRGVSISWDLVTEKLLDLLAEYINVVGQPTEKFSINSVLSTNLNHLANCLTASFTRSNEATLINSVCKIERICRQLSDNVLSSKEQHLDLKFQNVFILIILALKELSAMNMKILPSHKGTLYSMICLSLFHVHVLTQKIGTVGFPSYDYVYDNMVTYFIVLDDLSKIIPILDLMKRENVKQDPSKLIFYIGFLNKITNYYAWRIRMPFVTKFIEPLLHFNAFLNGSMSNPFEIEIKESIHALAITALSIDPSHSSQIAQWQVSRMLVYLKMSMDQYMAGRLSADQILIIFGHLSTQFPSLHSYNKHLLKDSLHETYIRIINVKPPEKKNVLIECLIVQIPFVNDPHHSIGWLNICLQLINTHNERLLQRLWEMVSSLESSLAIDWWYATVLPSQSSKL
ncbi:Pex8p [Saccharomyces paradoxus]|uniref:Pex8p n=1 Tax=Saccharomyces paradoxus TaxID=27291 RepID=A0A8B8URK5_SACPA|nr:Pex8 [Saccharomyces paradoxus]QHS73388.1 Pex8 [Saccharomyces paradoxus]